jgi:histone acetyltransferase (RNA polymerase elongator complex component)
LGEEGIELPWMVAGIRADRLTEASVRAMKQAGCEMVAVGVESIDPKVFPGINKGESISQILLALELCRRYGLEVGCYMVHGLPGDSYQRSIKYARKLQELDPDYIMYNHAIPFVGTELHSWVSRHGQFNPKFSWLNTRDFNSAAFWTDDFSHQQRLDSFRVIQTITHVVNFAGEDPGELDQLLEEVRLYDPDRLEYHRGYLERRLKQKGKAKNRFKKIHKENQFSHLPGYTGCVELASGRMV